MEVWKCLGEVAVGFLTGTFNKILESERRPQEQRRKVMVPICNERCVELWQLQKKKVVEPHIEVTGNSSTKAGMSICE